MTALMDLDVETPENVKRPRENTHCLPFMEKVKALLLRAKSAMEAFPGGTDDVSYALFDSCDGVTSISDVMRQLGGERSVAAKVFLSVMDPDERQYLEGCATKRKKQQAELVVHRQNEEADDEKRAARRIERAESFLFLLLLFHRCALICILGNDHVS